jgi:hypothetical protein
MSIIPGVQVSVVKEVVPPQLSPTGVLGLVGLTERAPEGGVGRASTWKRFIELFGPGSAHSMPEARQALQNGASQLVVVAIPGKGVAATAVLTKAGAPALVLTARAPGTWAETLTVKVKHRKQDNKIVALDLDLIRADGSIESHKNLGVVASTERGAAPFVVDALALGSSLVTAVSKSSEWPDEGELRFTGGLDAAVADYEAGLDRLKNHADVDLVIAAVQQRSDTALAAVHSAVIAHCNLMSAACRGRLGFGRVPADRPAAKVGQWAVPLVSDRFVLVAPDGVLGAVAGMIGGLPYFHSPTFKPLVGLGAVPAIDIDDQAELLSARIVPVAELAGHGLVVVRGLTTDGDQISVRRVADRAVRTARAIGELFIGRLNNADGRSALKAKLTEALLQMQKDGALVPSTDGKDPAFRVDVYASQADFGTGTVRVDIAVRPVRAIDFIVATILVQV